MSAALAPDGAAVNRLRESTALLPLATWATLISWPVWLRMGWSDMNVQTVTAQQRCTLSFEVHTAKAEADLIDACQLRAQAYGHHLGDAAAGFSQVDAVDRAPGTVVLVCRDKASGQTLGTARIQSSLVGALPIERCIILPGRMSQQPRMEVTRLAVRRGADPLVKLCLMKAVYLYGDAHGINSLFICARSEALSRPYRRLGFKDCLAPGQMLPLPYAGGIPHSVFTMNLSEVRDDWRRSGHRLYGFMFKTVHLDLPSFHRAPHLPAVACRLQA